MGPATLLRSSIYAPKAEMIDERINVGEWAELMIGPILH